MLHFGRKWVSETLVFQTGELVHIFQKMSCYPNKEELAGYNARIRKIKVYDNFNGVCKKSIQMKQLRISYSYKKSGTITKHQHPGIK